jgi:hypothetical protein
MSEVQAISQLTQHPLVCEKDQRRSAECNSPARRAGSVQEERLSAEGAKLECMFRAFSAQFNLQTKPGPLARAIAFSVFGASIVGLDCRRAGYYLPYSVLGLQGL